MTPAKTVTIVGGGLAGLALGIGLRRRQVPATILEAGSYPRHRVCGEFVSGQGEASLARLEVMALLERAGARRAVTASLSATGAASGILRLPSPALCVSRYSLDKVLADEFERLGGKLATNTRWTDRPAREGLVIATGRRPAASDSSKISWFGLKAHFKGVPLQADLELHLNDRGYIGLCRLDGDEVNVCGLFRGHPSKDAHFTEKLDRLLELAGEDLRRRLPKASMVENSFCSVAGLCYERHPVSMDECTIGDCLTLIPPFTGNGMSMAFEAAELAADPLSHYSLGRIDWNQAVRKVRKTCDQRFARRLAWARALHRLIFFPATQRALGFLIFRLDPVWRLAFAMTR